MLCSYEEAAQYLETYKAYENKPPDILKERADSDFSSRVSTVWSLPAINEMILDLGHRESYHSEEGQQDRCWDPHQLIQGKAARICPLS